MDKFFKLKEHGTNVKTELLAGITTFLAMAYILAVNPQILGNAINNGTAGDLNQQLFFVTAISAFIGTMIMGLYANLPVGLASGMGMNAFFSFVVVGVYGFSWQVGLSGLFISGALFVLLSLTGVREAVIKAIPKGLQAAIGVGIGFFIARIGLQSIHAVVASNDDRLTSIALTLRTPGMGIFLLGLLITFFLMFRKVKASIFIGIAVTTVLTFILYLTWAGGDIGSKADQLGIFSDPLKFQLGDIVPKDLVGQVFTEGFTKIGSSLNKGNIGEFLTVIVTYLFIDFFDSTGTLVTITRRAGLVDAEGHPKNVGKALLADSVATVAGTALGTTSVTSYIESLTGVEMGGRTGLTAVFTSICFVLALVLAPVLGFVSAYVTAPALIIVGCLMAQSLGEIDFTDRSIAFSAFIAIIMMTLTYSIANGIAFGFVFYVLFKLFSGEAKDVHFIMYILGIFFAFVIGLGALA